MFRAASKSNEETRDLLSLFFDQDRNAVEKVRQQARRGDWVCRQCRQEVEVRAGTERRWYFAHKSLSDCPLKNESAIILELRAVLFGWLRGKFGDRVFVEHDLQDERVPHFVDCWVNGDREHEAIAYWLQPTQMQKETARLNLEEAISERTPNFRKVFGKRMLKPVSDLAEEETLFYLSTTERSWREHSEYDNPHSLVTGGSLHYLDCDGPVVTTLRATRLVHSPQVFGAVVFENPITEMKVNLKGELVHPGEHENLKNWRSNQNQKNRVVRSVVEPLDIKAPEEVRVDHPYRLEERAKSGRELRPSPKSDKLPLILRAVFRCRECGAKVMAQDAQEMKMADRTCRCSACFWK